jgi:glutamate 5-kinase
MSFKDLVENQTGPGHTVPSIPENGVNVNPANVETDRLSASASIGDLLTVNEHLQTSAAKSCAAAGQFELASLYQSLFSPKGVTCSQLLLTQADFANAHHLRDLRYAVERLLSLGIVPIINENDAVSVHQNSLDDYGEPVFSDNDSLAALCARTFGAEVAVLLTDVEGVFTLPPSNPKAKLIPFHHAHTSVGIGEKSSQGRGGMSAKIEAAANAVRPGSATTACVVAAGCDLNCIRAILARQYHSDFGRSKGTLFATPGSDLETQALEELVEVMEVSIIYSIVVGENQRIQSLIFVLPFFNEHRMARLVALRTPEKWLSVPEEKPENFNPCPLLFVSLC